jgi:S-formylglutathione hydrolase FrmB
MILFILVGLVAGFWWKNRLVAPKLQASSITNSFLIGTVANAELRLLWIACGEQDGLLASNLQFVEWLKTQNVRCTWVQTPGQHSFRVWRRNLAQFTPLLFR